jgi:hypothetical protein
MSDNTAAPKLEDQIRQACRVRHYSLATERSYVGWYRQFVRWAGLKHPATLAAKCAGPFPRQAPVAGLRLRLVVWPQ